MNRPLRDQMVRGAIAAAERGWIPDPLIRAGIRALCQRRARAMADDPELLAETTQDFLTAMSASSIAEAPELANAQHYEVPPEFFLKVLGPALKYSSCYWPSDRQTTLAEAEGEALRRTCDNALLADGQRVLELGCGWGSLTLHMATNYPRSHIVAISNSVAQREFIQETAKARGLSNLEVLTADINAFSPSGQFDRIVSVEMFEHVRDHASLLERISHWLSPGGRLLVHVFCSAGPPYPYEDKSADDWMARNFFSGGVMPSDDLLLRYQRDLVVERQWRWSGVHYQKTLEAWLARLDQNRPQALAALSAAGERDAMRAVQRWRLFLMACSELFGYDNGRRWWVSHYRFRPRERL